MVLYSLSVHAGRWFGHDGSALDKCAGSRLSGLIYLQILINLAYSLVSDVVRLTL